MLDGSPPRRSFTKYSRPVLLPRRRRFASIQSFVCGILSISDTSSARSTPWYWPGSLGYFVQGAVDEMQTLRWYAESLNAACDRDIEVAKKKGRADSEALSGSEAV